MTASPTPDAGSERLPNAPFERNPFFTGRDSLLEELRAGLTRDATAALTQKLVLSGLGGIGKTQTALEFAYRYQESYEAVYWVDAETTQSLNAGYASMAALLGVTETGEKGFDAVIRAVKDRLKSRDGWLLVLDNANEPDILKPYLPTGAKGRILITSRAQDFQAIGVAKPVYLDAMTEDEALEFLLKRSGRESEADPNERNAAKALAEEMGRLPLALEQAGAYLSAMQASFQGYLKSYRSQHLRLLERRKPVAGDYKNTVATAWTMNFEEIKKTSEASADLLRLSAFLHPDNIPLEFLVLGREELGPALSASLDGAEEDPLRLDETLEPLTRYSLIRRETSDGTYGIHRLVQEVVREHDLDESDQRTWSERSVRALNAAFLTPEFERWHQCERLLLHAIAAWNWIEKIKLEIKESGSLALNVGNYLDERGRYYEAEPFKKRAVEIYELSLGVSHIEIATGLNNLAMSFKRQGRYREAEPLYLRALAIREESLEASQTDTAQSLNNLAALYQSQGRYGEAEPLYLRALAICEENLEANHPDTATNLNNLAALYQSQGYYGKAEPLYLRALAICEASLEANHPDTATNLNNLAALYRAQSRYGEAEPLYLRALAICEASLGANHPFTANSLSNLAVFYKSQGRYGEAEPLYLRALAIYEERLGANHPSTATSLNNLAALYESQRRYEEAEPLYLRALAIREESLGLAHPFTATVYENYAILLQKLNRTEESEQMRSKAQEIRQRHAALNSGGSSA